MPPLHLALFVSAMVALTAQSLEAQTIRAARAEGGGIAEPGIFFESEQIAGCLWLATYTFRRPATVDAANPKAPDVVLSFFTDEDWERLVTGQERMPNQLRAEEARFHTRVILAPRDGVPELHTRKELGLGEFRTGSVLNLHGERYLAANRIPTRVDVNGRPILADSSQIAAAPANSSEQYLYRCPRS